METPTVKAYDVETDGLHAYQGNRMFAFCIADETGHVDIYRKENKDYLPVLRDFWADTSIEKVGHHIKFDLIMTKFQGIDIPENTVIHDTMIQSQMLRNNAPSHSMEYLCWELAGWPRTLDQEIKKMAKAYGGYHKVPKEKMNEYQIADGQRTMMMHKVFFPDIQSDEKLYKDYLNEMELIFTTITMEQTGIKVDINKCWEMIQWMQREIDEVNNDVYELFNEYINLNSDKQIIRILYKILQMPILKTTKKTESPAVDKDVLSNLRLTNPHPVLDLILKQRSYTKGIANLKSYIELADKNDNNLIHPTINTNGAEKTGRESSENPNLQNVSKRQALLNPFPVPARKCFIAPDDSLLFFTDYSGIEMRIIIWIAQELELIELVNSGGDVHKPAAEVLFEERYINELDPILKKVLRDAAKNANFGIPYGAAGKKVAQILDEPLEVMIPRLRNYKNRWPGVGYFTRDLAKQIINRGYVQSVFGRKLYAPKNKAYMGANYIVQHTAAGILKRAQNKVHKYLKNEWDSKIRLVLPVHDELIIKYPKKLLKYKDKVLSHISQLMVDVPEIDIRFDVEWKVTKKSWDDARKIKVKY